MKKLLTFLTLLTLFFTTAWAAETVYKTLDISTTTMSNYVNAYDSEFNATNADGSSWLITHFNNGQQSSNWTNIRAGRKNVTSTASITTAYNSPIDKAITKVVVTVDYLKAGAINTTRLYVAPNVNFTGNDVQTIELSATQGEMTYTISNPTENQYYKLYYDCKASENGSIRISKVEYYYNEGGTQTTLSDPVIELNSTAPYFEDDNVIATITCPTEGAILYYKLAENDEWSAYTQNQTISITETTTIYAKAVLGDEETTASQLVTINPCVASVAGILALDENTLFKYTAANLVASAQKNNYLYAQDATYGMYFYGATGQNYTKGQIIPAGFIGKRGAYGGAPQVTDMQYMAAATGDPSEISAIEITPSDITVDPFNLFEYSVINGARIANGAITIGDESVTVNNNRLSATNVPTDNSKKYNVIGIPGWNNDNPIFYAINYIEKPTDYTITVNQPAAGGEISASPLTADEGDEITLTATPAAGYEFTAWVVKDADDNAVTVNNNKFNMPASNVTVTATFTAIKYAVAVNVTPENSGEVWVQGGCTIENNVSVSTVGTTVTVKLHTHDGYQVDGILVKDASDNEIATSLTITEDDGNTYTFVMPASAVTVTGKFRTYVPDVYYLDGELSHWDNGTVMTYDSENEVYRLRVIISDGDTGFFRFRAGNETYASGAEGEYWGLTGTTEGESTIIYKGSVKRFRVPAGIYDIVIGKLYSNGGFHANTSFTITKVEPTLTFHPAAGQVPSGTEVYVSSDLYELLSAVNSSITENDVTNMVKTDGDYAASVPITEATTVTGRAKYGHIEATATADYTIMQENNSNQYELVTDINDVVNNKKYLIVSTGSYKYSNVTYDFEVAATSVNDNDLIGGADVTIENNIITLQDGSDVVPYIMNLSDGKWTFKNSKTDEFLTFTNPNSGGAVVGTSTTAGTGFTLTSLDTETGVVVLTQTGSRTLQFNPNNAAGNQSKYRFTTYTSSQKPIMLFKQKESTVVLPVAKPVITPGTGTYTSAQEVTISCSTANATIWYKTNEMTDYAEYDPNTTINIPFNLNQSATITAYATKDGYSDSQVATAIYTFKEATPDEFKLVKSTNDLKAGYEYIIVISNEFNKAFGTIDNANAEAGYETSFTITEDHSMVTLDEVSNVNILTLGNAPTAGYYTFKQKNEKFIYVNPGGSQIKDDDVSSSYTNEFTISINGGNNNDNHYATIQGGGNQQILYRTYGVFRHYSTTNADNPEYRKIMLYYRETEPVEEPTEITLKDLIQSGTPGEPYKINNEEGLLGVYKNGTSVWFKDEEQAIDYQDPTAASYEYYTVVEDKLEINKSEKDFAQNNWIEVVFQPEKDFTNAYVRNLTGTYSCENGNPKLTLTVAVDEENDVTEVPSSGLAYELNPYMAANFAGNQEYTNNGETQTFFFSTPKAQEYAQILWAVWDGTEFIMPTGDDNYYGFTGSFTINPELNAYSTSGLTSGDTYNFKAIIRKNISKAGPYEVYPTDLNPEVPTAINGVVVNGLVKSVKYVNVAGMVSDVPFQGINIVVTEYTDGTRTTTKMLRK